MWTSDHILLPTSLPDPYGNLLESLTTLSYLAARTEQIGLATGVLVLPQRDPLLVAKQAATVHHLSDGRLTLGIGVGWIPRSTATCVPTSTPAGHSPTSTSRRSRALFETDKPDFHGAHIDYANVLFSPKPSVPLRIVVGGTRYAALKRAAALGDGWHGLHLSPDQARDAVATIDEFGRADAFEISMRTMTRVGGAIDDTAPETVLHGDPARS